MTLASLALSTAIGIRGHRVYRVLPFGLAGVAFPTVVGDDGLELSAADIGTLLVATPFTPSANDVGGVDD